MSTRIRILERVIPHIAVAVEVLGVGRVRDEAVRGDESAHTRVIPACAVVVQPGPAGQCRLVVLAGEALLGEIHLPTTAGPEGRIVGVAAGECTRFADGGAGGVQVVLQQVEDAVVTCVARAPQRIALVVLGGSVVRWDRF